jgi:hypothetical protein
MPLPTDKYAPKIIVQIKCQNLGMTNEYILSSSTTELVENLLFVTEEDAKGLDESARKALGACGVGCVGAFVGLCIAIYTGWKLKQIINARRNRIGG